LASTREAERQTAPTKFRKANGASLHDCRSTLLQWINANNTDATSSSRYSMREMDQAANVGMPLNANEITLPKGYRIKDLGDKYSRRDINIGTNADGGYTVPVLLSAQFDRATKWYCEPRQFCSVSVNKTMAPWNYPQLSDVGALSPNATSANSGTSVLEGGLIPDDVEGAAPDPVFGLEQYSFTYYSSQFMYLTAEFANASTADNIEAVLMDMLTERLARKESAVISADNTNGYQAQAVQYERLSAGNPITFDDLFKLKYSVDRSYRKQPKTCFVMADATIGYFRRLKTTVGEYLMTINEPGIDNEPQERFDGQIIYADNNMSDINNPTSGGCAVAYGDFGKVLIKDVENGTQLIRDPYTYIQKRLVGYAIGNWMSSRFVGPAGSIQKINWN
jgi:HK97 family phage major capsid protein